MGKSTSSERPLVRRPPRRRVNWFQKYFSRPLSKISPTALFVTKRKPSPARSIYINEPLPDEYIDQKGKVKKEYVYHTNQVVTSKYTVLTFLPRNLLEQFRRVANVFFAAIAILQFFPKFSTISPGLVILPLLAVLAITALKDGYEDIKRHQADRKVNHGIVHVLAGGEYTNNNAMGQKDKTFVPGIPLPRMKSKKGKSKAKENEMIAAGAVGDSVPMAQPHSQDQASLRRMQSQVSTWQEDPEAGDSPGELGWHRTKWEDIKVGDFVKVYDNEQFPADIMICATSEEEDVAYIETKNLDGETNLKSRNAVNGLTDLRTADACSSCPLRIDLEAPEVNMFKLNGAAIKLSELGHGDTQIHPISLETTLLRGCVLKNTAWVIGVVIFTGHDSKIVANSGGTPSKRSKVERQMNPQVLFNLTILAVIAVVCALVDHYNQIRWYRQQAYWELYADTSGDNPNINGLVTFANAFITFQNIVPISLYISIEFIRTAQALFIYWDHAIKYVKNGVTTRTTARSWTLSDDLGQIEYIFSDKTGTLTQNAMIFRQCSVGGKIYIGDGQLPENTITQTSPADKSGGQSSGSDSSSDQATTTAKADDKDNNNNNNSTGGVKVALPKEVLAPFHDDTLNRDLEDHDSEQSRILHGFFSVLGLCHTVLAAEPEPGVIEYKAQSPDEAALVQSAADVGFVFRGRDKNILRMSTPFADEPDEYELLHVLEFNSSRKRMSVILRKMDDDGRLFLLCKGADNVIFERLAKDGGQEELKQKTDKDLQQFASEGLRTLCLAYKVLDAEVYQTWAKKYHDATVALEGREEQIEEISAAIENDLVLLGATAIEDKLQDGVPEAIADLKQAGIKIWVATGDKLETAVAIGYTTNLLTSDTNLIIIREGRYSVADQIREALESFFDEPMSRQVSRAGARPKARRLNTGVTSLVGQDNGTRPGGFSLVIEGHALTHAFNDEETEDLLLDLSTRCNTVICCRVSPLQKAQIVRLIKDNLGVMCLAIGDGANDVSMIQAADVGVGISGEEGLQAVNSSDYAIAQFRYLTRLLFVHGHWSYYRNSSMILNFFYKNIIGIGVLFWYMIYCGWSTTYVLSYTYLLFWNVFWTLTPVLAIGLFDRNCDADILMAFPELYKLSKKGAYFGLAIFWYYMFEGIFESAIIYFFIHYTYDTTTVRTDGYDVYIYEMSTTMAIAAVMVANAFHAINIRTWVGWTYFAIALGPFLVWVYTAIFSIIPPSSFATGVYGNQVFLFRSAAYWFGWIFVFVLALLPRYLFLAVKLNYFPDAIDELRLIRKYHPDVDFTTHPAFARSDQVKPLDHNPNETETGNGDGDGIAMNHLQKQKSNKSHKSIKSIKSNKDRPANPRASMSSYRLGMNSSARGSQVDMSMGGLHREASRGFDFNMEEGGVAVQRMQSRLSERSAQGHRSKRFLPSLAPVNKDKADRKNSISTPFGITRIRERAGSVFSRKRAGTGSESGAPPTTDSPVKSGSNLRPDDHKEKRMWGRRGTHETTAASSEHSGSGVGDADADADADASDIGLGNGRHRPKGSGNDDPRRPGEEGGMEDTGSRGGVGEDSTMWGPKFGPPEPPRL